MRRQHRKRRHSINRQRRRNIRRQTLGKERNAPLGLASGREELALEVLVVLGDEEGRRAQGAAAARPRVDLVIEELLDVVDREQVFAVHRDDDSVPDLRDKDL